MGARHAFLQAGGKEHHCIECPNGSPEWLAALADFSVLQIADWPTAAAAAAGSGQRAARNSLLRHAQPPWRWVPCSRLDRI